MKTVLLRIQLHQNTISVTGRQTNFIINNKCFYVIIYNFFFCMFRRSELLSCKNVNRFVSVYVSVQRKRSDGNLVCSMFIFLCV